jgi:hypothetical protein
MGVNGAIRISHLKDGGVAIKEGLLGDLKEVNTRFLKEKQ